MPCGSCSKRQMPCSLVDSSQAEAPPQLAAEGVQEDPPQGTFEGTDFALFHHFTTSTAHLITLTPADRSPFMTLLPGLAPQHPYLLHEVLALAALHLSHLNPTERTRYTDLATGHHSKSLALFRPALEEVDTPRAAVPLFMCSALYVTFYFTLPTDPA